MPTTSMLIGGLASGNYIFSHEIAALRFFEKSALREENRSLADFSGDRSCFDLIGKFLESD